MSNDEDKNLENKDKFLKRTIYDNINIPINKIDKFILSLIVLLIIILAML